MDFLLLARLVGVGVLVKLALLSRLPWPGKWIFLFLIRLDDVRGFDGVGVFDKLTLFSHLS